MRRVATTIVTRGTSGIGRAVVQRLLVDGVHVAVVDRNHDALALLEGVERRGSDITLLPLCVDVTDAGQVDQMVAQVAEELGTIDALVNDVGGG